MCSSFASVAPEFYLHHTFLDKLWFQWQQHSKACLNAKFSNSHGKMSKFACPFAQSDMMNSEDLPGHVKVIYTDYYYHYKEGGRPTGSKVSKGQQKKTQGTVRVHDVGLSYQEIGKRAHEAFANDDLSLGYSSDDPLGENELGDHSENKFGDGVYDTKGGIASLQYAAKDSIVNNQPKKYKESWKVGEDSTRNEYCRSKDKSKLESKFVPPYEKICYKNYIDKVLGYWIWFKWGVFVNNKTFDFLAIPRDFCLLSAIPVESQWWLLQPYFSLLPVLSTSSPQTSSPTTVVV